MYQGILNTVETGISVCKGGMMFFYTFRFVFHRFKFRNNFSRVEIIFMGVILQYFHGKTLSSTGGFREIFHGQDRLFKGVKLNIFTGGVFFFSRVKKNTALP